MNSFVEEMISAVRSKVGSGRVLCALSGGVDSSVAAVLMSKAVGRQADLRICRSRTSEKG